MEKKRMIKAHDAGRPQSSLMHNPFGRLKGLVDRSNLSPSRPAPRTPHMAKEPASAPQSEEQLFFKAMEGVSPLTNNRVPGKNAGIKCVETRPPIIPENEALSRLVSLINHGEGFFVSDTPEYMEGTGYNVHQEFAQRLHRGDFSIQAHIDLHGLNVEQAREAFDSFLKESLRAGKRAVLVIHGRGLSSPGEPVLKNKVREWLGHSYWLKRVIAYASAQSYDGGPGATYVLLRNRPVSKKSGKARSGI